MLTEEQQAEVIYKKLQGKASTNADRAAYEEPFDSALILTPENFWFDAELIPSTAPVLAHDGDVYSHTYSNGVSQPVLKYYVDLVLLPVPGSVNAFYHPNLRDSIAYNYRPDGSFLYTLKDSNDNVLAFGLNNWVVDNQAGVLTFYDGVPTAVVLPLKITFYQYVGRKSFTGLLRSDGSVQMEPAYVPTLPQDVVTKRHLDQGISLIDTILDKLKPAAPPNLSAKQLTISGLYSAFEAGTGAVHADCTNNPKPSITPDGPFFDADAGTVSAFIDGSSVGTRALSAADDAGTYGALVIVQDVDAYAGIDGKQNFYKELYASIMPVNALTVAQHRAKLTHTLTGSTPEVSFHIDDPASPIVLTPIFSPPTTTRWVSGVPSLGTTDTVQLTFQVKDAVKSHYGAMGARMTSLHFANVQFPILGTPENGATLSYDVNIPVLAGVYTERAAIDLVGLNSMQLPGTTFSYSTDIRIDTISNENRVKSGTGETPAVFGATFDSQHNISDITNDEELQLLGGLYQWPSGNYLNNRPIAGPDYRTVPVPAHGFRWATFQPIALNNANGFTISVGGAQNWISGDDRTTLGVRIYARVMQDNGTPVTGWIDCNSPYPGVGMPGSVATRHKDPAMVAGSNETTATSKKVTFGPAVYSGKLYIRVGLPVGDKKFSTITVVAN
jgi:hypothetical protein